MTPTRAILLALVLALALNTVSSASVPDEDWAYVQVRPGANMFWYVQISVPSIILTFHPFQVVVWTFQSF